MFKVLIVDDEEIVRKGLSQIINWEKIGFEVSGEAASGDEAIQKIVNEHFDLVLLDMKMPGKSGLDVLKETKELPNVPKFLILSGYADFQFAQTAINEGAKGYLVKPVDEDLLEEKVISIASEILTEYETQNMRKNLSDQTIVKKFTKLFLTGKTDDFSTNELTSDNYIVITVSVALCGYSDEEDKLVSKLTDTFSYLNIKILKIDGFCVIICKNTTQPVVSRYLTMFCNKIKNRKGAIGIIGKTGEGINGALASYKECRSLENLLFFYTEFPFITIEQKIEPAIPANYLGRKVPQIIACIEAYEPDKLHQYINSEAIEIKRCALPEKEIKNRCISFLLEVQHILEAKFPNKISTSAPDTAIKLIPNLLSSKYFSELINLLQEYTISLAEKLTENSNNATIAKVVQYVRTNYNIDLKLEALGDLFSCNSAYLGKRFKEYTGSSFNNYVDLLRINKAKELLQNPNLKVYEISELVGYSNTDYFYLKFRKITGHTPKDYKRNNTDKEEQ